MYDCPKILINRTGTTISHLYRGKQINVPATLLV